MAIDNIENPDRYVQQRFKSLGLESQLHKIY